MRKSCEKSLILLGVPRRLFPFGTIASGRTSVLFPQAELLPSAAAAQPPRRLGWTAPAAKAEPGFSCSCCQSYQIVIFHSGRFILNELVLLANSRRSQGGWKVQTEPDSSLLTWQGIRITAGVEKILNICKQSCQVTTGFARKGLRSTGTCKTLRSFDPISQCCF